MTDDAKGLLVDIWWSEPMAFSWIPSGAWFAYVELIEAGVLAPFSTRGCDSGLRGIRVNDRGRELAEELAVMDEFSGGWAWVTRIRRFGSKSL
jgi:hypothetical protein